MGGTLAEIVGQVLQSSPEVGTLLECLVACVQYLKARQFLLQYQAGASGTPGTLAEGRSVGNPGISSVPKKEFGVQQDAAPLEIPASFPGEMRAKRVPLNSPLFQLPNGETSTAPASPRPQPPNPQKEAQLAAIMKGPAPRSPPVEQPFAPTIMLGALPPSVQLATRPGQAQCAVLAVLERVSTRSFVSQGGVPGVLAEFHMSLLAQEPFPVTAWTDQLAKLAQVPKSAFVDQFAAAPAAIDTRLQAYVGRLFVVEARRSVFRGELRYSALKVTCVPWGALGTLPAIAAGDSETSFLEGERLEGTPCATPARAARQEDANSEVRV